MWCVTVVLVLLLSYWGRLLYACAMRKISSSTEVWNDDTAHICERSLSSKLALVTDCSYTR